MIVERRRVLSGALFGLLTPIACGGTRPAASASGSGNAHPLLGAQAPDFSLAQPGGGEKLGPAQFRGKLLIVDFWATWCAPCRESFPVYQKLVDAHAGKLVVLGVSVDDEASGIETFRSETGVKFPLVWDEGQAAAGAYKPATMPTSYIIDRAGVVKFIHEGFHDGDEAILEQELQSLSA